MKAPNRALALYVAATVVLGGCGTAGEIGLFQATDLSVLEPGMSMQDVHNIAAFRTPNHREEIARGVIERFSYGRGYRNRKVEETPILCPFAVGGMALIEMLTLGLNSRTLCTLECQTGWLYLRFDRCGYLVAADESVAEHDGYCPTHAGETCRKVAASPQPSNLSGALARARLRDTSAASERCLAEEESR